MSGILYVEVQYDPQKDSLDVVPASLTLTPGSGTVVWWCGNLPPGRLLDVRFKGREEGPFATLAPQGEFVIGSGNTGQPQTYPYRVEWAGPEPVQPAVGEIVNTSQEETEGNPVRCVYNPSGPPVCYDKRDRQDRDL